jgi:hypothetical protein
MSLEAEKKLEQSHKNMKFYHVCEWDGLWGESWSRFKLSALV